MDASDQPPKTKPRRDVLLERINGLEALRYGRSVDTEVRANLTLWGTGKTAPPADIAVRAGFVRRLQPLLRGTEYEESELVDRPKPDLPRRPPLAALTSVTKGVGLRTELTLLYLAQTGDLLGKNALLKPTVDGDSDTPGLIDLIAIPATHTPSRNSTFASSPRNNRKRQIREALVQLAKLGVTEVPPGGRRGEPRFDGHVHLNMENGSTAAGAKRYTVPSPQNKTLPVPTTFFTNGWIHALSRAETAMWLMLRDLHQRSDDAAADRLMINGRDRLLEYDLSRAVWDTHSLLEEYGLIAIHRDPNRRPNGTTTEGRRALPHYFELRDEGLTGDGLATVINALNGIHDGKAK